MSSELETIQQQIQTAIDFGFQWPNVSYIINKLQSECDEVSAAVQDNESLDRIQDEIGDVFHVLVSLCNHLGLDVQETLQRSADKFDVRFKALKEVGAALGYARLSGLKTDELLRLWSLAKER